MMISLHGAMGMQGRRFAARTPGFMNLPKSEAVWQNVFAGRPAVDPPFNTESFL